MGNGNDGNSSEAHPIILSHMTESLQGVHTVCARSILKVQKVYFSQKKLQKAELFWIYSFFAKTFCKRSFLWTRGNDKKHFRFNPTCSWAVFLALYFPVVFCNGSDYHTQ
jgi:hypothetical protein